jgi:hypothetical protein
MKLCALYEVERQKIMSVASWSLVVDGALSVFAKDKDIAQSVSLSEALCERSAQPSEKANKPWIVHGSQPEPKKERKAGTGPPLPCEANGNSSSCDFHCLELQCRNFRQGACVVQRRYPFFKKNICSQQYFVTVCC